MASHLTQRKFSGITQKPCLQALLLMEKGTRLTQCWQKHFQSSLSQKTWRVWPTRHATFQMKGPALTNSGFRNFRFLLRTLLLSALAWYSLLLEPKSIIIQSLSSALYPGPAYGPAAQDIGADVETVFFKLSSYATLYQSHSLLREKERTLNNPLNKEKNS